MTTPVEKRRAVAGRSGAWMVHPLACMVITAACVLVTRPFVELGFNDDFSYVWAAQVLARTGHIAYNGWGAMMLGWQLYLGAAFLKLFGFSFTAIRVSVFLVALLTVGLMQRVIVRCGLSETSASFATLTVALSPLFLPLSFTYMSDIPAFFCLLLCFYGCLRAMEAEADRQVVGWLVFAAVSNVLVGTVRQVAWLGVLVVVPCAAWCLRRRRGVLPVVAVTWVVSAIAIFACLRWFAAQPFTFSEPLVSPSGTAPGNWKVQTGLTMIFCALPVLVPFLARYPLRRRSPWTVVMVIGPILYFAATQVATQRPDHWLAPFSGDEFSAKGVDIPLTLVGNRPDVMHLSTRIALTILVLVALTAAMRFVVLARTRPSQREAFTGVPSAGQLAWLFGPYCAIYILLIVTRGSIFDRYWLPILFVAAVALLRVFESLFGTSQPWAGYVALMLLGGYTVAGTHDLFASLRAELHAAEALQAAGFSRDHMYAGVEFDGWTQLEVAGHVNNPRVKSPPYRRFIDSRSPCAPWWESWFPDVHGQVALSWEPLPCAAEAPYGPFAFTTWLAPRKRAIYVLADPPLMRGIPPGSADAPPAVQSQH